MPKPKNDGGWILPEIIEPPRRCICIPVPDEPAHRQAFYGALLMLGYQHNWQRDAEHKALPVSTLWMQIVTEAITRFNSGVEYMCFSCEQLNECLVPLYEKIDALEAQNSALTELVEQVKQTQEENAAKEIDIRQSEIANERCGGATGVVMAMWGTQKLTYQQTEVGLIDNVFEAIPAFVEAVPMLDLLLPEELFSLVNWYFENQFANTEIDFEAIKQDMICDLNCLVQAYENTFDWDVWAEWLYRVGTKYPTNRAAQLFARYAPMRQTWVNQIAALINQDASLQSYFEQLNTAWEGGLSDPQDCSACACECITIYRRPGNVPADFVVTVGAVGTGEVLAESANFGGTAWTIADFSIPITNATRLSYVTDVKLNGGAQFYTSAGVFVQAALESVQIAPGKWEMISEPIGGVTGTFDIANFRQEIGNLTPYKWLEIRVYEDC